MATRSISQKLMEIQTASELTWTDDFSAWLAEERSPRTVEVYRQDLATFCTWFERTNGQVFVPGLMNSTDVRAWREYTLSVERLAPATWNRRRAALKVLCEWIKQDLRVGLFPFDKKIKPAFEQEQAPRWLNQAEERALMRQVEINIHAANTLQRRQRAVRDQALVAVMRYAGLRVEEVANLLLSDLQLSERKGMITVRLGKREKTRHVPLSSSVREALAEWLAVRGSAAGFLFLDGDKPLSVRGIQKRIEGLADQTGIDGLTCHALRHTCAKSMVDAGRPLTEVKNILGHEKIETTAHYVRPGREDLAEAVEAGELGRMRKGR